MPAQEFTGAFDTNALNVRITQAQTDFTAAWDGLKTTVNNIASVSLNGSSGLPCFDSWDMPVGDSVQLCFAPFADDLAFIGQGILFIATLSALSIVFRG